MTSLSYLMFFLPISLIVYAVSEFKSKKICLLVFSIIFLLLNNIYFAALILFLSCLTYLAGKIIISLKNSIFRKIILIISSIINVFVLFSVHTEYLSNIYRENFNFLFPFGISFFVIQSFIYLRDCCFDKIYFKTNFIDSILYLIYFPKFLMGPVMTYDHFIAVFNKRKMTYRAIANGFSEYITGFSIKIIIADSLYKMITSIVRNHIENISISLAWYMAVAFFFYVYFIFYSYSKMAEGTSKMFGISVVKNTSPYIMCESVGEFQKKYNRTVLAFFERSFSDLFESRIYLSFIVPVLTWISYGIWYGFNISSFVFGAILGGIIALENFIYKKKDHRTHIIRRIVNFVILTVLFVFLMPCSISEIVEIFKSMFGFGTELWNDISSYYFKEYLLVFVISILAIINAGKNYKRFIKKKNKNDERFTGTVYVLRVMILICAVFMLIRADGISLSGILL